MEINRRNMLGGLVAAAVLSPLALAGCTNSSGIKTSSTTAVRVIT